MYISLLELNLRSRKVQYELSNRYELHRTILHAFYPEKPENERTLFRLELQDGSARLIVQTTHLPSWSFLVEDETYHGYLLNKALNPQIKLLEPKLSIGQHMVFRLFANPTVRKPEYKDANGHGKRIGLYKDDQQLQWLNQKGIQHGFVPLDVRTTDSGFIRGTKKEGEQKHTLNFLGVQFDGVLEITDPIALEKALANGIGSAKGFGCGLLSLARI